MSKVGLVDVATLHVQQSQALAVLPMETLGSRAMLSRGLLVFSAPLAGLRLSVTSCQLIVNSPGFPLSVPGIATPTAYTGKP